MKITSIKMENMVILICKQGAYVLWLVGQAVKTPPSHGGTRGSIPLRDTIIFKKSVQDVLIFFIMNDE